jgi:hypothetical protein
MVIVKKLMEWRLEGKPKYSEKTCPRATFSITNPTWLDPGRRGEKPATNRFSYGAVHSVALIRKRTIETERPPLVGEVSANFCG